MAAQEADDLRLDGDLGVLHAEPHVAFEVFRAGPADATLTEGKASEREQFRSRPLQGGKVYVVDRGYESYGLPAGVTADRALGRLGTARHKDWHEGEPLRVVVVENRRARAGEPPALRPVTDELDWPAEVVALAYRYRRGVELFFRWRKSVLGCRHLLSHPRDGVAIQVYCALIASVLLGLWTGGKPDVRTFEMFCHFFSGWATEREMQAYLRCAQEKADARAKKGASP